MYVIAYNIVQHHEDAEDVVLAAWERIIKNLDKISKIDCQETKALIVIIVERIAIDFIAGIRELFQKSSIKMIARCILFME